MSKARAVEPLRVHFDLKDKGSCFSDIARRVSRGSRKVSPQNVRAVVYGYTRRNAALIWAAIDGVLNAEEHPYTKEAHSPQSAERAAA